ncbi:hypothetical protein [Clostridium massiliamazoniense]|uniref:hypothetical protein n=1 Tax=Clostridium massiliamazoniense TaxID=1347366 RepID=UPI0006D83410|nr:hypothetical protein [Clostridium massiliamazoniense]
MQILDNIKSLDRNLFIGIAVGILISVTFMSFDSKNLDKGEIEKKAMSYGMHYEDQCKVIFK